MSTNYYMKPKIMQEIKVNLEKKNNGSMLDFEEKIIKGIIHYLDDDSNWLHIGKRSYGWKPTFHKTNYWSSVDEIINFYEINKDYVYIIDEYGKKLSIKELKENLIDWNKDNKNALTPFDKEFSFNEDWLKSYYKDKDGYIFTTDDFS